MFDANIPAAFAHFLEQQRMVIIGAADPHGAIWSTMLAGEPGLMSVPDERTVVIDRVPGTGDPLHLAFESGRDVGMIALEPQSRRRIRVNGVAVREGSRLVVRTEQVLGNCPKYLQTRTVTGADETAVPGPAAAGQDLTASQVAWIEQADTFFIASRSPEHGADCSSRGGMPGFVTATGSRRLSWPDYTGNQFYMTLGNLHLDAAGGLLFVDWERGHTLHLTGTAQVDWTEASARLHPGSLRVIEFDVEAVVQIDHAVPLRWRLEEYSRFNPPVNH